MSLTLYYHKPIGFNLCLLKSYLLSNKLINYSFLYNVNVLFFYYFLNMKNKFLILILFNLVLSLTTAQTHAFNKYNYPTITNSARGYNYRPMYNPYGSYYNPYYSSGLRNGFFRRNNLNTDTINKIRYRNAIRNNINSLLNRNRYYGSSGMRVYNGEYYPNNTTGSLTGYSVPITSSALNLIPSNVSGNTLNTINNNSYSPTNNMKLFQSPLNGQELYFNDGRYYKDLHGLDSSSGVKIIYD